MQPFYEERSGTLYAGRICRAPFPLHMHRDVELIFPLQGSAELTIGNDRREMKAGDCAVIFPMVLHSYNSVSADWDGACMIFPATVIPAYSSAFRDLQPGNALIGKGAYPAALSGIIGQIPSLSPDAPDEMKKAYIHLALAYLFPALSLKPKGHEEERDTVQRVLEYLSRHYTEPVSLVSLSDGLKISVSHLSHIFSRQLNINFRKYINILRVDHAKQLLQTDMPLTEICAACGYEDDRTFRRAFTDLQGVSPSEYRKLLLP